jgi:hypothetical protein
MHPYDSPRRQRPFVRHVLANPNPRCATCRKHLIWFLPQRAKTQRAVLQKARRKVDRARHVKNSRRLAIRCVDCFGIFCSRCAHKHFVPVYQLQGHVLRAVDRLVEHALKVARCKGVRDV